MGRFGVCWGPGAGIASAVVSRGPEPERLARTRAAAQMVVERGMFKNYLEGLSRMV